MFGELVTRRRRAQSGVDRYGNPVYADVEAALPERAAFDPGGSREPVEVGREQVVTTPKLYFPRAFPDLMPSDRVRVRGVTYSIEGEPAVWIDPFGSDNGGTVVELKRAEG